jgi:hypothetical protein
MSRMDKLIDFGHEVDKYEKFDIDSTSVHQPGFNHVLNEKSVIHIYVSYIKSYLFLESLRKNFYICV